MDGHEKDTVSGSGREVLAYRRPVNGRRSVLWRSWRAAVDEDGHYSCAVALWCCGRPRAPIGKSATHCDLALRRTGGGLPDFAGWSGYPPTAAVPINPRI